MKRMAGSGAILLLAMATSGQAEIVDFDQATAGRVPPGWTTGVTGAVGVWTKADSVTQFDDLSIASLDAASR